METTLRQDLTLVTVARNASPEGESVDAHREHLDSVDAYCVKPHGLSMPFVCNIEQSPSLERCRQLITSDRHIKCNAA